MDYLEQNNLLCEQQHGFLNRRSSTTQILTSLLDWIKALCDKQRTDCIYVDIAKAFDSVSHRKLLLKLKSYGVDYELHNWISSFISNRTQFVLVNGCVSESVPVLSGVPQGTVLGPILFLLYINDVVECFDDGITIKLFADDCKIYNIVDCDSTNKFLENLRKFEMWCSKWQLRIATDKCCVFSTGKMYHCDVSYSLNDSPLSCVDCVNDLGVLIPSDLKFSSHCSKVASSAYSRACILLKGFVTNDKEWLVHAYKVFVRPILEHNCQIFNPILQRDINCIERVQRFFTRRVCKRCKISYKSYEHRLKLLGLDSLRDRRKTLDLYLFYKSYHGLVDVAFWKFFVLAPASYCTRSKVNNPCQVMPRFMPHSKILSNFFFFRVYPIWNRLPSYCVCAPSFLNFKSLLKSVHL